MKRSQRTRSKFTRIFSACWRMTKALLYELTVEIILAIGSLGFALLLARLGISDVVAIALGLIITIVLGITVYSLFNLPKLRTSRRSSEVKFANWIAKTLFNRASGEWLEYQDWVHDILLARIQLLDRGFPLWKAALITYWRLGGLCVVMGLIKLRRIVISAMRWR